MGDTRTRVQRPWPRWLIRSLKEMKTGGPRPVGGSPGRERGCRPRLLRAALAPGLGSGASPSRARGRGLLPRLGAGRGGWGAAPRSSRRAPWRQARHLGPCVPASRSSAPPRPGPMDTGPGRAWPARVATGRRAPSGEPLSLGHKCLTWESRHFIVSALIRTHRKPLMCKPTVTFSPASCSSLWSPPRAAGRGRRCPTPGQQELLDPRRAFPADWAPTQLPPPAGASHPAGLCPLAGGSSRKPLR